MTLDKALKRVDKKCETWKYDALHPRVSLQIFGSSHGVLEMPLHAQVQCLQPSVAQVAVKGRRHTTEGWMKKRLRSHIKENRPKKLFLLNSFQLDCQFNPK